MPPVRALYLPILVSDKGGEGIFVLDQLDVFERRLEKRIERRSDRRQFRKRRLRYRIAATVLISVLVLLVAAGAALTFYALTS